VKSYFWVKPEDARQRILSGFWCNDLHSICKPFWPGGPRSRERLEQCICMNWAACEDRIREHFEALFDRASDDDRRAWLYGEKYVRGPTYRIKAAPLTPRQDAAQSPPPPPAATRTAE